MSDAVTALGGATAAGPSASVAECPPQGMVTLRGDLGDGVLAEAVRQATGCDLPAPRQVTHSGAASVAWMSPDELLLLVPYENAGASAREIAAALVGSHALAVEVSDARAVFRLSGGHVREVLARNCPADLSPATLPVGEMRRSRLGQVAVAVWFDADDSATLISFRSVADYVFRLLAAGAAEPPLNVFKA